ncbi:MAG: hypothetical protein R3C03_02375 [Pirellulaceae bacterium]
MNEMFKNMTARERRLALVVSALLPMFLVFWGVTSFMNSLSTKNQKIISLQSQVSEEEDKLTRAKAAADRRRYYESLSLPQDVNYSKIEYERWLDELITSRSGMTLDSIKWDNNPVSMRYNDSGQLIDVAEQLSCKVVAKGTLPQITQFLDEFYRLNLMHRIYSIDVVDRSQSNNTGAARRADGTLNLDMEIQLLKLSHAVSDREFTADEFATASSQTETRDYILRRDVFGLANNAPAISTSDKKFQTGEAISFDIASSDPDDDNLKLELISSDIPDFKFETTRDGKAEFSAPKTAKGDYKVVVRVEDDGLPVKFDEKTIRVAVSEPEPKEEPVKDPPKPPFRHAQAAYITGFKGDTLWIHVKTTDQKLFIPVGETFELDGSTWKVINIDSWRKLILEKDGEIQIFRIGDTLDTPREMGTVDVSSDSDQDQ